MKKLTRTVVMGALLVLVGSCSSVSYVVDWDTQNDFSGYRTFAWFELAPSPDKGQPPSQANAIVAARIRRSVTNELQTRGLSKTEVGEADVMVTYALVLQSRVVMYNTGWAYPYGGWRWGWGGWGGGWSSAQTYTEGTLVVDVLDGASRRLVWRGVAERAFTKPNPSDDQVAAIVAKVMAGFPPNSG